MDINHFRLWASRMGLGQRQIGAAAELIGINNKWTASNTYTGKRELAMSERLAMSAVRAGLKPCSPEYDAELQAASEAAPATVQ